MKKRQLSDSQRAYFSLVSQAAFTNPFSPERRNIDQELCHLEPRAFQALSRDEQIDRIGDQLHTKLSELASSGVLLKSFVDSDVDLLYFSILFNTYHRYSTRFDQHIQDQLGAGTELVDVPFSGMALKEMRDYGITKPLALRAFSMFFQMRRAYYFIHHALVGRSTSMKQLRLHLWNNLFTSNLQQYEQRLWDRMEDFSILLLGETGTGKGAAASAIGRSGFIPFDEQQGRFKESFVENFLSINLSQFPETLIESELFGHRKGAFTGAIENYSGAFSRSRPQGAIFLDEIGDVSVPIQIKLLQVLQDRVYTPVGDHEKRRFKGRIIAATNQPLTDLRRDGKFRDDFYYRLCSDSITVPTLRQRIAEDPSELSDLLEVLCERILGTADAEVVEQIHARLLDRPGADYPWPGNVRELEQAIRRVIISDIYEGDAAGLSSDLGGSTADAVIQGNLSAQELLQRYCNLLYQRHGTYEEVARRTELDRRTVKKYIEQAQT
jgi:DNA-binding NtrC family response regulator